MKLELCEYHYFDDIISEFKLTPPEIQIPIPKYYVVDAENVVKDRHAFISIVRSQIDVPNVKVSQIVIKI